MIYETTHTATETLIIKNRPTRDERPVMEINGESDKLRNDALCPSAIASDNNEGCKRYADNRPSHVFASASLTELSPRTKAACNKFRQHLEELRTLKGLLLLDNPSVASVLITEPDEVLEAKSNWHQKTYIAMKKEENTIVEEEIVEEDILIDFNNNLLDEDIVDFSTVHGYPISAVKDSCRSSITGPFLEDEYSYYEEIVEDDFTYYEEVVVEF